MLLLNLHNSLVDKEGDHVCRLSLFASFWVDNRTGYDLVFKDLDAPPVLDRLPCLGGWPRLPACSMCMGVALVSYWSKPWALPVI